MYSQYYDIEIPSSQAVDYTDISEVCAYQDLLFRIYANEGGLDESSAATPLTREIARQGFVWLREVKKHIETFTNLSGLPRLLRAYDLMHRVSYSTPDFAFLRDMKLKAVDRWLKGDKSICKTDVVLMLLGEIDRDIRSLEQRYVDFSFRVLNNWIKELNRFGRFREIPLSEAYRRLEYLMNADLFGYYDAKDQPKIKQQWANKNLLNTQEIETLDTDTLADYARFIEAIPCIESEDSQIKESLTLHLLRELSSRKDMHPYMAKSLDIALSSRSLEWSLRISV